MVGRGAAGASTLGEGDGAALNFKLPPTLPLAGPMLAGAPRDEGRWELCKSG